MKQYWSTFSETSLKSQCLYQIRTKIEVQSDIYLFAITICLSEGLLSLWAAVGRSARSSRDANTNGSFHNSMAYCQDATQSLHNLWKY